MKESKTGKVLDISLLFRVIAFAKPYKKQFIIATISAIILSFLGPIRPMLINYAIDNFIIISDPENLLKITILLIALLLAVKESIYANKTPLNTNVKCTAIKRRICSLV